MVDGDWGEGVLGFCWSDTGSALLVQQLQMLRCFAVGAEIVEIDAVSMAAEDLVGFGHAAGDWWLCTQSSDGVFHQRGLYGEAARLAGAAPAQVSRPSVSPDGQKLACVVSGQSVAFWTLASGERRFGVRVEPEGDAAIFGPASVEEIR
jgi:hypothetical protein